MTNAMETLTLAVMRVAAGQVTRPAPPPTCWPDEDEHLLVQRTNAYYSFLPTSRVSNALSTRGAGLPVGVMDHEADRLYGGLSELWLLDEVQVGTWTVPGGDPLDLLIEVAPALWADLHSELIVDDLRWRAHDDGPYPHARLLAQLDARR
ncbi:hypothetical protein [Curtobacterium herbarum]|uniref:Uncharacterized protein n=1 Tax=Curtobacterium herbarum TaxID=150122 RepID=A0ABN1ZGX5_9MICO|nr:hypothetical protein [Curtobacterium herbarum]MBM7474909.1 hypothetical protein [Curtobacterium herbarum]MCS6545555.1 hypothetical protein [Curtobacterium herbarum]